MNKNPEDKDSMPGLFPPPFFKIHDVPKTKEKDGDKYLRLVALVVDQLFKIQDLEEKIREKTERLSAISNILHSNDGPFNNGEFFKNNSQSLFEIFYEIDDVTKEE